MNWHTINSQDIAALDDAALAAGLDTPARHQMFTSPGGQRRPAADIPALQQRPALPGASRGPPASHSPARPRHHSAAPEPRPQIRLSQPGRSKVEPTPTLKSDLKESPTMQTGWRSSAPSRRPHHSKKLRASAPAPRLSRKRQVAVRNSNRALRQKRLLP